MFGEGSKSMMLESATPADHPHGLEHDLLALQTLLAKHRRKKQASRRRLLGWLGAAALAPAARAATVCAIVPSETNGPYPGDGSNTLNGSVVNALLLSGIVRSDIRASIAGASGTASGVPLTITLTLVNADCQPLAGYAIYIWHCTADGNYSLYSSGVTNQNYLRGVQQTDANGQVSFTTIFPGCYSGRMPHVHFEIYPSLAKATSMANVVRTSQFTFPMDTLNTVYTASGYSASVSNLAQISYASDLVFSDGYNLQLASMSGNNSGGYTATLQVAVNAQVTSTAFNASMTASGDNSKLTLTGNLIVASADVGTTGSIYVALLAGSTLFFHNGSSWVASTGANGYPAYYTGTLAATHTLNVLAQTNISSICGLPIFIGYGASATAMLAKSQYKLVYTLCQ
jgi:protocatechuate 3,4-dioxygenase beta subunit